MHMIRCLRRYRLRDYIKNRKYLREERQKYKLVRLSELRVGEDFYWGNPVYSGCFGGRFVEVLENGVRIIDSGCDGNMHIDTVIDDRDVWIKKDAPLNTMPLVGHSLSYYWGDEE